MTTEDIIRLTRQVGGSAFDHTVVFTYEEVRRFMDLVAAAERERIIAANAPEIERINAHIEGMRDRMLSEGWRQCAQGQTTTQFCAVAEQARLEEREACARVCESRYMGDNNREDMEARRCSAAIRARGQQSTEDNPSF